MKGYEIGTVARPSSENPYIAIPNEEAFYRS
jgi:hypothetical protein